MKKTITVTKEDLKNNYTSNHHCPIAEALRREFPEKHIFVSPSIVYIGGETYRLPEQANRKSMKRSQSILGRVLGGFTFELEM